MSLVKCGETRLKHIIQYFKCQYKDKNILKWKKTIKLTSIELSIKVNYMFNIFYIFYSETFPVKCFILHMNGTIWSHKLRKNVISTVIHLINIFCIYIVHLAHYSAHSKCSSLWNANILSKGNIYDNMC